MDCKPKEEDPFDWIIDEAKRLCDQKQKHLNGNVVLFP